MKEYLSLVIVTVICIVAITCAAFWRVSKSKVETNYNTNVISSISDNNINIYDENNKTSKTDTIHSSIETLKFEEIKAYEGAGKSYSDVKDFMLKFANNNVLLNAETFYDGLKINYTVALKWNGSSGIDSVNECINKYLKEGKTYSIKISVDNQNDNRVNIIITSNS